MIPLDSLKRPELDDVATDLGMDPKQFSKKDDLIDAIAADYDADAINASVQKIIGPDENADAIDTVEHDGREWDVIQDMGDGTIRIRDQHGDKNIRRIEKP